MNLRNRSRQQTIRHSRVKEQKLDGDADCRDALVLRDWLRTMFLTIRETSYSSDIDEARFIGNALARRSPGLRHLQ